MSKADSELIASYVQLLSLAAHELRTPVSVMSGYLKMLRRDGNPALGDRQRKWVDDADKACERMIALINELSDVGKLDAGRTSLQEDAFDLFSMIEDAATAARGTMDRDIRLSVTGPAQGAPVRTDRARIQTAFAAIFYAVLREQHDSTVIVAERRLARDGSQPVALVVIAREGEIEDAVRATPATFDEKRAGLGLALPIARRVIERGAGRVWSPGDENGIATARGGVIVSFPLAE